MQVSLSEMNFDLGGSRRKGSKLCNQDLRSSCFNDSNALFVPSARALCGRDSFVLQCVAFTTEKQLVRSKTVHACDVIRCLFICHSGGGISSYAGQLGAAGRSLEVCLDQAVKDIPKERHRLTPVYLGATAGMRLLQ